MRDTINLTYSPQIEMPYINEEGAKLLNQEKGWSLSYAYYFSELRDIYLALKIKRFEDLKAFTNFCLSINLPYEKTKWNKRRVLEHLNALKNFSLVSSDYRIIKRVFNKSKIGDPLSQDDLVAFNEIYFSYFRFKEVFSWFIDPNPESRLDLTKTINRNDIQNNSKPLFAFSKNGKFVDTFFFELKDNVPVYYIRHKNKDSEGKEITGNEDLMRFWDVFIKWGTELKVLEKFNLRNLGIKTSTGKNIVCCYIINYNPIGLDLLDYLRNNYLGNYVYLPHLVFKIATELRLSIEKTHELIIAQYKLHKEYISFERTSEIFIKEGEIKEDDKILFPKHNDSYISHLVVRK